MKYSLPLNRYSIFFPVIDKFLSLVKYHLLETTEEEEKIKKELAEKLDAMAKRKIYSQYKTAPTEEEREKARQEYLDKVGISPSFRW